MLFLWIGVLAVDKDRNQYSGPKAGETPRLRAFRSTILVMPPAVSALDLFAGFEVLQHDFLLSFLALGLFHVVSVGWSVCDCELSLAPNNSPCPPVTLFFGIRSRNRMPEGRFGAGLERPEKLAGTLGLRVTG
jgi:hypothetical protein